MIGKEIGSFKALEKFHKEYVGNVVISDIIESKSAWLFHFQSEAYFKTYDIGHRFNSTWFYCR
jgi:cytoplasmic iron level regulating protein YaaA (DUF328/UPF0246 family)